MQLSEHRVPAFALLELASAVSLTSADTSVSNLAAQTLRLIAIAERQPDVPINPALTEEERVSRHAVYEKIGAPRTLITGSYQFSLPSRDLEHFWAQAEWRGRSESDACSDLWRFPTLPTLPSGKSATSGGAL
jgi:hypothetical protein